MPTLSNSPVSSELVAEWYDSDLPSRRTQALQLWSRPGGTTELVSASRATPADVWSPPVVLGRGVTEAQAQGCAALGGLDRFLPRPAGRPELVELAGGEGERWTIVTDEGLAMFREDLFDEAEARAYVAANPETANGKAQLAVSESVARKAARRWREIETKHEAAKRSERRLALAALLYLDDEREAGEGRCEARRAADPDTVGGPGWSVKA